MTDYLYAALFALARIYNQLETEYDHQNSDSTIDENIECNEYQFIESGELA